MKKTLLILMFFGFIQISHSQIRGYALNDVVDNFQVTTLKGDVIDLYEITAKGQYVILDFFFVDCPPCQQTAPMFNEFYEKFGCNTGDVFSVSINNGNDDNAYVQYFEDTYGGTYMHGPAVSNEGGGTAVDLKFDPSAYPTYTLITPENKIVNLDIWPLTDYTTFVQAITSAGGVVNEKSCESVSDVEDVQMESLSVFPNPANHEINLNLEGRFGDAPQLELVNSVGAVVLTKTLNPSQNVVDLTGFANGLYKYSIADNNRIRTAGSFSVQR